MPFQTGNAAADKLLNLMGEHFIAMPWFDDEDGVKFMTLVDAESEHAVAIQFADRGEPEFVFNKMTFARLADDEDGPSDDNE